MTGRRVPAWQVAVADVMLQLVYVVIDGEFRQVDRLTPIWVER